MNAIAIASALSSSIPDMRSAQIAGGAQPDAAQDGARMTREQSKANTRERLLAAARSVFASSGFHGAAVEEIDEHAREIAQAVSVRQSVAERATGGARQWMTMIEREPELLLLFMEFWAYGVRDAQVRPKVAARFAQVRRMLTRLIADGVRDFELELEIPAEQLAVAVDALADGI